MVNDPNLNALLEKLINVQSTYIGNNFDDVATQELLLNAASQINLMQDIIKTIAALIP